MTFHINQKVICVNDKPPVDYPHLKLLRLGCIYVIRGIELNTIAPYGVLLGSVFLPRHPDGSEECWDPERFRPVIEKQTDISALTALLDPTTPNITVTDHHDNRRKVRV